MGSSRNCTPVESGKKEGWMGSRGQFMLSCLDFILEDYIMEGLIRILV